MNPWTAPRFFIKPRYGRNGKNPSDMVILGARVLTCDERRSRAQAVAVKDGEFTYVGGNSGAKDYIGESTRVFNARGRMLVPGFVDNHLHLLWMGALGSIIVDLYGSKDLDEIISRVSAHADANPNLPLLMGIGWMYEHMPGGMPDSAILDKLFPDRPVFLLSYEACTLWTNSLMHDLMWKKSPEACRRMHPETRGESGEPTGIFLHSHSFNPFEFFSVDEFAEDIREKMLKGMADAIAGALKAGVTAFDELQLYRSVVPLVLELKERGGFDEVRARAAYYIDPVDAEDWDALSKDIEWWKELGEKETGPNLILGESLKLYMDGVHSNHTAFFKEPYCDDPGNCGAPTWTQEDFDRFMELADGMHMQVCTHTGGDAAINRVINSYQRAGEKNKPWDARHRVDHCEYPLPDDRKRMAEQGIYAAMQPIHFFGDESLERVVGIERLQWYMPWKSLEEAGVEISCGTDWLAVTELPPINPMYGLVIMATRMNYKMNTDWGPDEKVDIEDAIRHYTIGGAKAMKMEERIGSIEVGKCADFAIFHTNLLKIASWLFLLTNKFEAGGIDDFVDMTVVGGRPAYTREGSTF